MKDLEEKIAVMQAALRGERIEACVGLFRGREDWATIDVPSWNWDDCDYRVAPAKPLEFTLRRDLFDGNYYVVQPGKSAPAEDCIRVREIVDAPMRFASCEFLTPVTPGAIARRWNYGTQRFEETTDRLTWYRA